MVLGTKHEGFVAIEINQYAKIRLTLRMSQTICRGQQHSVAA